MLPVITRNVRVSGDKELLATLHGLPDKVQRRVLRPAVRAALTPVSRAAKATLTTRFRGRKGSTKTTGELRRSIGIKVFMARQTKAIVGKVGPMSPKRGSDRGIKGRTPGGYHGYLVEMGHRMVVGGSVTRLRGRSRIAPIEAKGKVYTWKAYIAGRSQYRSRIKRLREYLAKRGAAYAMLGRDAERQARGGGMTELLRGAIETGGMYRQASGRRGRGRVVGNVRGYPFLGPAWTAARGTVLRILEQYIAGGIIKEANVK